MKKCSCCQKELPESEFYKNKAHKDGLQNCCKSCQTSLTNKSYRAKVIRDGLYNTVNAFQPKEDFILGGIKCTILNKPKVSEKTFNISNINTGENFSTNDKEHFFAKLEKLLGRAA